MKRRSMNEIILDGVANGSIKCPEMPQGISKTRVEEAMSSINRNSNDIVDAVFALLDESPSWYSNAPKDARFCDGASTAQIGAHIGILQRGNGTKLDREGRDYWIKPLIELGIMEPCYLASTKDKELMAMAKISGYQFFPGHLKAKSPNCCYRLVEGFPEILKVENWLEALNGWISDDQVRRRAKLQADAITQAKRMTDNSHSDLIKTSVELYVTEVLSGYEVVCIGDADGITDADLAIFQSYGLEPPKDGAWPDVLLINPEEKKLWVIEAVTSDGEVDSHKVTLMKNYARQNNISDQDIGFTTTYPTWKKFAERQKKTKTNIADNTYVWILESASSQMKFELL